MASTSGVTLDKVIIEIESSANQANDNIASLSKTLNELKSAIKGGFNNLSKLATSLEELNNASRGTSETVKNLKGIGKIATELNKLSNISTPRGLKQSVDSLDKLPGAFAKIDATVLENVAIVSKRLASALDPLANKLAMIGTGFSSLSQLTRTYGVSLKKIAEESKNATKETDKLNKASGVLKKTWQFLSTGMKSMSNKAMKPLKKLSSQIKQIGLSLLGTRTIFTLTRKAVSEYAAMDQQLSDSIQNTWRAFGAQLAPAIEYVMYLFKQFVRVIYSIVYALTGIDLIARANAKALEAMNKSAKDALGSLQKFDDLNVAEFDKGSGDTPQIELEKIDLTPIQEVIDWMKRMKDAIEKAWADGSWNSVAKVLADGINGAVESIDGEKVGTTISNVLIGVVDFVNTLLAEIKWYELGLKIREILSNIDWKTLGQKIWELIKTGFKGAAEFFNGLFGFDKESDFGKNLITTLLTIWVIIQVLKGIKGISGLMKLVGFSTDTATTASLCGSFLSVLAVVLAISQGLDSWSEYIANPTLDNEIDAFFDTLLTIVSVVGIIAGLFLGWPVLLGVVLGLIGLLIVKFIAKNWKEISGFFSKVGDTIAKVAKQTWDDFVRIFKLGFAGLANLAMSILESIVNGFITAINWVIKQLNKLPDVDIKLISKWDAPKFDLTKLETGTNEIPYEGIYHLHAGEAVVPKKYNPALGNGGTDEELGQKIDILIDVINNKNWTNTVNIGNKTVYKEQQRYNKMQNDKYGTTVNL